jgi:hypothetical protein
VEEAEGGVAGVSDPEEPREPRDDGEIRDELPEDLDAVGYVGPYTFPNNDRRRIQGALYLGVAVVCVLIRLGAGSDAVLANDGFLWVAGGLALFGVYCVLLAGKSTEVDETDALVIATRTVGFPVGHASASLGWRGLGSRPMWRILLYSAEDPPATRGFVMVDAVDGSVAEHFTEENPEDWDAFTKGVTE